MRVAYLSFLHQEWRTPETSVQAYCASSASKVIAASLRIASESPIYAEGEASITEMLKSNLTNEDCLFVEDGIQDAYILNKRLGFEPGKIIDLNSISRITDFFAQESKEGIRTLQSEVSRLGKNFAEPDWAKNNPASLGKGFQETAESYLSRRTNALRWVMTKLAEKLPVDEINVISDCNKAFGYPSLIVDIQEIDTKLDEIYKEFEKAIDDVKRTLPAAKQLSPQNLLDTIRSDKKLFTLLQQSGANPPEAVSFSKDSRWVSLKMKTGSLGVIKLLEARLLIVGCWNDVQRAKSIRQASAATGDLSIGLRYFGAVTSRIQVDSRDKINFQGIKGDSIAKTAIRAKDNEAVMSADYTGIELRVALHLVKDEQKLDLIRRGEDLYISEGVKIFNIPQEQINGEQRDTAKEIVISGIYGASGSAMQDSLYKNRRISLTDEQANIFCKKFRSENPLITNAWDEGTDFLERAGRGRLKDGETLFGGIVHWSSEEQALILPSGLSIQLPNVKKTNEGFVYGPHETKIYGSKVFQNVVQGVARSILSPMWTRFSDAGKRIIHCVHDSVFWTTPTSSVESDSKFAEEVMCQPVPWAPNLPLDIKVEAGVSLADMVPVKVFLNSQKKPDLATPSKSPTPAM